MSVVTQVGIHRGRFGSTEQPLQGRQHLLGEGELHGDRVDLGHGEQALGIAHAQEVAFVHGADTDPAGDRRMDLGVRELHLGGGNRRLVALGGGPELIDQRLLLIVGLF